MAMEVGVFVWLKDDERLVEPCVSAIKEVFPGVEVYDVGSTDDSISIVKNLNVPVHELGSLNAKEYIKVKRELHEKFDYVFNIDADEVYPRSALELIKHHIQDKPARINAYWRMLKYEGSDLYVSSPKPTGEIAWDPKLFELRRIWPHECLKDKGDPSFRKLPQVTDSGIYCWHGVLLDRSRVISRNREIKKENRDKQFESLEWKRLESLPWM